MKRLLLVISVAILAAGPFALSAGAQAPVSGTVSAEMQSRVRTSYIFTFADDVSAGQLRGRAAALVAQGGGTLGYVYGTVMKGFSARMGAVAADNLFRNNDDVVAYTRDGIASIAAKGGKKGSPFTGGGSTGQTIPWGITRVVGERNQKDQNDKYVQYGSGKTVCVIDTGVDVDHPDLDVDVTNSRSFVLSGKDYDNPDDQNGHGTHVAGTIAAKNNGRDVVGVAAGAKVVSVRVLDKRGSGWWSWVIAGVEYVATAKVGTKLLCDAANMSLGGGGYDLLDDAVEAAADAGVKFALAAGNSGADAKNYSPARAGGIVNDSAYDGKIFTVSAIDINDKFAYFSNYGNPPVDVAAPGVSVLSLWKNGGTNTISGTSMAAPHVAGLLLLGNVSTDDYAIGDPDGNPDPIAHR